MTTQVIEIDSRPVTAGYLISKENSGAQVVETGRYLTIGRSPENGLELADPYVSTHHAVVEKREAGFLLKDLKSQNGTYVNGTRVVEVFLNEGDLIRIGEREFSFQRVPLSPQNQLGLKSKNEDWNRQLQSIPLFAQTDLPVLLLGGSGTGKEVIANAIHKNSRRSQGPFVSVNCSALSESLIESELFGHVKGSYTGAVNDRKGAFESARGGTLFLDEIGDLPLSLQPKLLRALENREIRPVGSDRNIETDVRIVAATHKNLQTQVVRGTFRADLFYRIHVVKILIPPLAERMEDFDSLLYGFAREMRVRFSHDAILALKQHTWPGNIRELKNLVARASALFSKEQVEREHINILLDINLVSASESAPQTKRPMIKEIEKDMIVHRLLVNRGNQRKTAADLGMPKSTLHDRIKTYEIDIDKLLSENVV